MSSTNNSLTSSDSGYAADISTVGGNSTVGSSSSLQITQSSLFVNIQGSDASQRLIDQDGNTSLLINNLLDSHIDDDWVLVPENSESCLVGDTRAKEADNINGAIDLLQFLQTVPQQNLITASNPPSENVWKLDLEIIFYKLCKIFKKLFNLTKKQNKNSEPANLGTPPTTAGVRLFLASNNVGTGTSTNIENCRKPEYMSSEYINRGRSGYFECRGSTLPIPINS